MNGGFSHGYAVLIGVDENCVARLALPDVAKDIDALSRVLVHPDRCAYLDEHVKVVRGKAATQQGIREGLSWLHQQIQADSSGNATAIVYYSGHAWRNESVDPPESYLIPYDIKEDTIEFTALEAEQFARDIAKLNARRLLVVLDCCHAAAMGVKDVAMPADYVGAALDATLLTRKEKVAVTSGTKGLDALSVGQGRAVLNSSTGEQISFMRPDRKMSVFTYHLIEALTGHAEPKEGATEVLVSDVMSYVYRKVPQTVQSEIGAQQTPDFQVSGNFAVASLLGGKGLSKGQPAPDPIESASEPEYITRIVDTGGGAYTEGNVNVLGGKFIGRDEKVSSEEVHGDKWTIGEISGTGAAVGRGGRASVIQGIGVADITKAFAALTHAVNAMPDGPEKRTAQAAVEGLATEAKKGDGANENAVRRWLNFLAETAPDAWEVAVQTFTNPIKGLSSVFAKIAQRARASRDAQAGS